MIPGFAADFKTSSQRGRVIVWRHIMVAWMATGGPAEVPGGAAEGCGDPMVFGNGPDEVPGDPADGPDEVPGELFPGRPGDPADKPAAGASGEAADANSQAGGGADGCRGPKWAFGTATMGTV